MGTRYHRIFRGGGFKAAIDQCLINSLLSEEVNESVQELGSIKIAMSQDRMRLIVTRRFDVQKVR
jgi:hypothetical protein